jgi:hypothetical protein
MAICLPAESVGNQTGIRLGKSEKKNELESSSCGLWGKV